MKNFNQLTPAETERLAILIEEAAEVQHIACKVLRHGYECYSPFDELKRSNRTLLAKEVGQLNHIINKMIEVEDIDGLSVAGAEVIREDKIKAYLHHQGTSTDAQ